MEMMVKKKRKIYTKNFLACPFLYVSFFFVPPERKNGERRTEKTKNDMKKKEEICNFYLAEKRQTVHQSSEIFLFFILSI